MERGKGMGHCNTATRGHDPFRRGAALETPRPRIEIGPLRARPEHMCIRGSLRA